MAATAAYGSTASSQESTLSQALATARQNYLNQMATTPTGLSTEAANVYASMLYGETPQSASTVQANAVSIYAGLDQVAEEQVAWGTESTFGDDQTSITSDQTTLAAIPAEETADIGEGSTQKPPPKTRQPIWPIRVRTRTSRRRKPRQWLH